VLSHGFRFDITERVKVAVISPDIDTIRFSKPRYVLLDDIEPLPPEESVK